MYLFGILRESKFTVYAGGSQEKIPTRRRKKWDNQQNSSTYPITQLVQFFSKTSLFSRSIAEHLAGQNLVHYLTTKFLFGGTFRHRFTILTTACTDTEIRRVKITIGMSDF